MTVERYNSIINLKKPFFYLQKWQQFRTLVKSTNDMLQDTKRHTNIINIYKQKRNYV